MTARSAAAHGRHGRHGRHACLGEQAWQRAFGHDERLPFGQQLRQMGPVDAGVGGRRQLDEARSRGVGEAVGPTPPAVAMDERGGALG